MEQTSPHNTFRKGERLCSQKLIAQLFAEGDVLMKYPFRVVYMIKDKEKGYPAQVIMSVSKRRFKRANKRNLLRRRMKEAFRLNKHSLYEFLDAHNKLLICSVIYLPTEELDYVAIEKGMKKTLARLMEAVSGKLPQQTPL
jgi:ribonuclease P protein component